MQSRIRQGKGPVRIRAELAQRSVRDTVVHEALQCASGDWVQLARDVRRKKFGHEEPSDLKARSRQTRFLEYRGFEPDQIRRAIMENDESD